MKIGKLDQHCGNCSIMDYCAEPFDDLGGKRWTGIRRPDNLVASILYGADRHECTIAGDVIFAVRRGPDDLPPENPELLISIL